MAENEIVPLQPYSLSCIDTFHISLSPAGKLAVFLCKTKQFLLQVNITKFSREKSLLNPIFNLFILPNRSFGLLPPKPPTFQSPTLHILLFCLFLHTHDWLSNCCILWTRAFIVFEVVLVIPPSTVRLPSCRGVFPSFSRISPAHNNESQSLKT